MRLDMVMDSIRHDLRYALRSLRRSPAYGTAAVLSFAIGIGACTAVFGILDAVMLRKLPVRQPEDLVLFAGAAVDYPLLDRLRTLTSSFDGIAAVILVDRGSAAVTRPGERLQVGGVSVALVTGNYFRVLGADAATGRTLDENDDRVPEGRAVAVVSRMFAGKLSPRGDAAVGSSLEVNGTSYAIVGVTREGFSGDRTGRPVDVWIPARMESHIMPGCTELRCGAEIRVIGLLHSGVTIRQAETAAQTVLQQFTQETAGSGGRSPTVVRDRIELRSMATGYSPALDSVSRSSIVLMMIVALLLLIACVNIANLMLARSSARQTEIAVRLAIGAGRATIVRQLLTEGLIVALAGGALGLVCAQWSAAVLAGLLASGPAMALRESKIALDVSFDERVMVFAATLCLLTGCLCSLAPAWRTRKMSLTPALSRRIGAARSRGIPWGASLVVLQVAASLVVLVGSGLFVRTLWNLRNENLGFARHHLLLVWTTPGDVRGTGVLRANLWHAAQDRLAALPGVRTVAAADGGLLNGIDRGGDSERMKVEGQPPRPGMRVRWMVVTSRFFETAGIPLIAGRDFTERDAQTSARVTIINETMARFYFGRENPIGKHLGKPADAGYPWEIVGVVGDTKTGTPRSDSSKFIVQYFPYRQDTNNLGNMCLVVRTDGVPTSVAPRVRQALADIEPLLPVTRIDTVDEQLDDVVSRERLMATLSALLGALAALLACLGLYGLMTYTVARRTQEIGLRMALGATRSQVARHVLRHSAGLVVVGVAIGVPLALAGTRLVAAQLFGVGPGDPLTVTSATVLTVVLGVLAGIVPLYRASRVDPLIALRGE